LTYPPDLGPLHPAHRYYLLKRDFNPESLAEQWGLRGIGPKGGRWAWRIFIPIYNRSGAEVSYTSRAIGSRANPRYLTLENEDSLENPRSLLYGEQKAIDRIIVVEGPSDVWRLGNGAVATMGTSWTAEQATKIARFKWRFILFDNERPAQHAAQKLAAEVAAAPGTTEIVTGLGTDPGDLTSDEVLKLRRELGFGYD
jgi:DNA primase